MIKLAAAAVAATLLVGGVAHAADLIVDEAAPVYDDVATGDWTGPYLGASIGYGAGTVTFDDGNTTDDWGVDGWVAGLQAGYNAQSGNLVYGFEGSINWSGISGVSDSFPSNVSRDINWTGDLTGKLGFAVDSLLFYGKAGVAFTNTTSHFFSNDETETHTGWTAGLGVAAKVNDDMSVFAEYDYADYGAKAYSNSGGDIGITTGTVKVGLNWHF